MPVFLLRRAAAAPLALLAAAVAVFVLAHLAGGDPAAALAGEGASPAEAAAMRRALGLDAPAPARLAAWLAAAARGDLGTSLASGLPVAELLARRLPTTLALAGLAFLLSLLIAAPLLLVSTRSPRAEAAAGAALAALFAAPVFLWGHLLAEVFAVRLGWLPALGLPRGAGAGETLRRLLLPALALAPAHAALAARLARPVLLASEGSEHAAAARARGESAARVLLAHRARPAALALISAAGLSLAVLLGGAAVVESIFQLPGVGRLAADAARARDHPVLLGTTLALAALVVALNLALDVLGAVVDPRLRAAPAGRHSTAGARWRPPPPAGGRSTAPPTAAPPAGGGSTTAAGTEVSNAPAQPAGTEVSNAPAQPAPQAGR